MKILHVITTINRGGAENHLRDLISGQINKYDIDIMCAYLKGDSYWKQFLTKLGCQVYPLNMADYGQLMPALRLRRLIRDFSPSIVHTHLAPAELYTRLALLGNAKIPLVISRHNHDRFYNGPGAEAVERWVTSRAQRFIGISESVRKYFTARIPGIENRFDVVPYGIDPSPMTNVSREETLALRQEWGVDQDTVLLGTVARLVPVKSHHTLLDGYARLRDRCPMSNVKLVLVGAGPLDADLQQYAADLGLRDSVIWAGFREDIPAVMNALDVFILTSLSEGFGLVLLEAMSASKPVISTNVSALPEIVVEGETGLMIPPEEPDALAEAIKVLLDDVTLRDRFGKAAYMRVISDFSLDTMWAKTMAVYADLLSKN